MLFYGSPFILQFFYVSSAVVYRQVFECISMEFPVFYHPVSNNIYPF